MHKFYTVAGGLQMACKEENHDENHLWDCPNNGGVACNPKTRDCKKCGWNPEVAKARLAKIIKNQGVTLPKEE